MSISEMGPYLAADETNTLGAWLVTRQISREEFFEGAGQELRDRLERTGVIESFAGRTLVPMATYLGTERVGAVIAGVISDEVVPLAQEVHLNGCAKDVLPQQVEESQERRLAQIGELLGIKGSWQDTVGQ